MASMTEQGSGSSPSRSEELGVSKDVQTQTHPEPLEYDNRPCFFRYITAIARTWGIFTCVGLWFCTVRLLQNHENYVYIQWYNLCLAIIVTFFEFAWILSKCIMCKDDGNCCCTCWRVVIWVDNWKKSVFYMALSVPTFTRGKGVILSVICGVLVITLAVFYMFKTCKYSDCIKNKKKEAQFIDTDYPKANLVSHEVQTATSDYSAAGQTYTNLDQMAGNGYGVQAETSQGP